MMAETLFRLQQKKKRRRPFLVLYFETVWRNQISRLQRLRGCFVAVSVEILYCESSRSSDRRGWLDITHN